MSTLPADYSLSRRFSGKIWHQHVRIKKQNKRKNKKELSPSLALFWEYLKELQGEQRAWVKGGLALQPLYHCCGCTNPSCKACRWSSKRLSNIHQAGGGSAACEIGWNRRTGAITLQGFSSFFLTFITATFVYFSDIHLLTMGPAGWGGCLVIDVNVENENVCNLLSTFLCWSFAALRVKVSGWLGTDQLAWRVCEVQLQAGHRLHHRLRGRGRHPPVPWQQPASHPCPSCTCLQHPFGVPGLSEDERWRMSGQDWGRHTRNKVIVMTHQESEQKNSC